MATKELLVLHSLYSVEVKDHAGRGCLPVGLPRPGHVQALQAPAAHGHPEVLGVQRQADLEGELEAVEAQRLPEADALPLGALRELRPGAAQELVRAQALLREEAAGLLADHRAVDEQHADHAVGQRRGRGLDAQLAVTNQVRIAEAADAAAAHLDLRVHEGVQVLLVDGHEDAGVDRVPEDPVGGHGEVVDAYAVVVDRVVKPRGARRVDEHHARALLVREALPDAVLMFVLVNVCAIHERVVLETAIGVGIYQEVPDDGRAGDRPVVLLPREDGRLPVAALVLDGVQVHAALDQDARVRRVEAHALDAAYVLLLVDAGGAGLVLAGVEPDAVVHARGQVARPQRHEGGLHVRLEHDLAALLVGPLDDRHLAERRQVREPGVAGGREGRELGQVAVDPAGLRAEGEQLAVLRPVHVRDLGLRPDLDALALHLLPVLHLDEPDTVVARGRYLARDPAAAEAVQAILVVFHRGQLLGDLAHLRADDDDVAQREAYDQVAIAKPAVALDGAVLDLEGQLRRLLRLAQAEKQQRDLAQHDAHGLLAVALVGVVALDVGELDHAWLVLEAQGVLGLHDGVPLLAVERHGLVLRAAREDVVVAVP
mmetsp:Transcript_110610/g.312803  ORF Transcript_110610/g.312803 Transcript_110610/m.312803 type:complete len:600 (+) Transcript_110610:1925-3724(+)